RLKSNVRGMSGEKPTGAHFKTVSLFEPKRRLIQTWALDEAGQVLYFEQRDLNRTRMGPRKLGDARLAYMVSSLLLEWDGETMVSATRAQGLPVLLSEELLALPDEEARRTAEQVTLARTGAESTVAWVLGTEDTPRLWVEKDSFLPM